MKTVFQNDFRFGLSTDGGDRFRSTAVRIQYRDISAGVNLFTGEPPAAKLL